MTSSDQDYRSRFITLTQSSNGRWVGVIVVIILAYCVGYYHKYSKVKANSVAIIAQGEVNKTLDEALIDKEVIRQLVLKENLESLFSVAEIAFLYSSKDSRIDKLKARFTEYLPGKTIYVARTDCSDDYLGVKATNDGNRIIIEGNNNRMSNQ